MNPKESLLIAVRTVGTQKKLADLLTKEMGHTFYQSHVNKWIHETEFIPSRVCKPIEKITKGKVKKHQLRPDLWENKLDKEVA